MKPIATFHVRPERRSRLAVRVEIFDTVGAMRQLVRREDRRDGRRSRTRGLVGMCQGVTVRIKGRKTGLYAVVRIPKPHLTMSTITHEAFHATCRWAERRGLTAIPVDGSGGPSNMTPRDGWIPLGSVEERAATVHDELCRRMVIHLRRLKLVS